MMNYDTEILKYRINFTNVRGEAKHKICYTMEQTHKSCQQIKDLGGKVVNVQQIRNVIFYD